MACRRFVGNFNVIPLVEMPPLQNLLSQLWARSITEDRYQTVCQQVQCFSCLKLWTKWNLLFSCDAMSGSETVYCYYFFTDTIYGICLFGSCSVRITFLNAFILAISVSIKDILFCYFTRWRTVRKAFNNSSEYSWGNFSVQILCLPKLHFWSTETVCSLESISLGGAKVFPDF